MYDCTIYTTTRCGIRLRHRTRLHSGSDKEVIASVSDYGVMEKNIPDTFYGGQWTRQHFLNWLQERRNVEEQKDRANQVSLVVVESHEQDELDGNNAATAASTETLPSVVVDNEAAAEQH